MNTNVLIFVSDPLVEADVRETVADVLDEAQIRVAHSAEDAVTLLGQHKGWAWAVIDAKADGASDPQLRHAFDANHALPVVLGRRKSEAEDEAWVFLDPPFNTRMLEEALKRTHPREMARRAAARGA